MKKLTLLTIVGASLLYGTAIQAQQAVVLENSTSEYEITSEIKKEPQLVPIQLVKDPETGQTIARLSEIQSQGATIGINRMMLEGRLKEEELSTGRKQVSIVWDTASLMDEKSGEKKTTPFGVPFLSKVVAAPDLEGGDAFNAQGDPIELMLAYQRLTQSEIEEEEDEEDTTPDEDRQKTNNGGTGKEGDEKDFKSPEFAAAAADEDFNTVTESCGVRVDMAQMVAIEQERVLIDGEEVSPCEDTLDRYPISKEYGSCPDIIDSEAGVVYRQYVLVYTDPNEGEIQAQDCTQDVENPINLIETTEGCSIVHDFGAEVSYQQYRVIYTIDGKETVVEECQNGETTYEHTRTQDGCDPIITDDTVTFQFKTTIDVDGLTYTVLDCQPDPSTSVAVESEECTGSYRFTHDYDAGQSFLNMSYYYLDGAGEKEYVSKCIASSTTYTHEKDETVCTATNNDSSKETLMNARTFISDNGSKVYLSSCEPIYPAIAYVPNGNKWSKSSSSNSTITLSGSYFQNYSGTIAQGQSAGLFTYAGRGYANGGALYKALNGSTYEGYTGGGMGAQHSTYSGQYYCIAGKIGGNWNAGGIILNQTYSDQSPSWSKNESRNGYTYFSQSGAYECSPAHNGGNSTCSVTFSCSQPTCLHTHLKAHPSWTRGDGSTYSDTTTTTGNMHVCGNGSKLNGKTQ